MRALYDAYARNARLQYTVDYDTQTRLELVHRHAEDELYRTFHAERQRELRNFEENTKEEWERALAEFARRYEANEATAAAAAAAGGGGGAGNAQRAKLIHQLTLRRDRALETITHRRKERERLKTTELFDRQANEMLDLYRTARHERVRGARWAAREGAIRMGREWHASGGRELEARSS